MTVRSGKVTTRAAVMVPRLVMESAHSGAEQVLSGGNQTKRSCECGAPAFRGSVSTSADWLPVSVVLGAK